MRGGAAREDGASLGEEDRQHGEVPAWWEALRRGEYSLFDVLGKDEAEYRANVRALDFHKADYKFY